MKLWESVRSPAKHGMWKGKNVPRKELCRCMSYEMRGKRGFYKRDWKEVFKDTGRKLREIKKRGRDDLKNLKKEVVQSGR